MNVKSTLSTVKLGFFPTLKLLAQKGSKKYGIHCLLPENSVFFLHGIPEIIVLYRIRRSLKTKIPEKHKTRVLFGGLPSFGVTDFLTFLLPPNNDLYCIENS